MSDTVRFEIDMDKKCKNCGKPGACQNGLCLKCTSKVIIKKMRNAQADESTKS